MNETNYMFKGEYFQGIQAVVLDKAYIALLHDKIVTNHNTMQLTLQSSTMITKIIIKMMMIAMIIIKMMMIVTDYGEN